MKNNKEIFIKYLDDQLNKRERRSFEAELKSDPDFSREYDLFCKVYYRSKEKYKTDDRYFPEMIPRAKERSKVRKKSLQIRYSVAFTLLLIGIFVFYEAFILQSQKYEYNFEKLFESFTYEEEVTTNLFIDAFDVWNHYSYDDLVLSSYFDEEEYIDESLFDYLSNNVSVNEINDELINGISEEEFSAIFNEIKTRKFIGEK